MALSLPFFLSDFQADDSALVAGDDDYTYPVENKNDLMVKIFVGFSDVVKASDVTTKTQYVLGKAALEGKEGNLYDILSDPFPFIVYCCELDMCKK